MHVSLAGSKKQVNKKVRFYNVGRRALILRKKGGEWSLMVPFQKWFKARNQRSAEAD